MKAQANVTHQALPVSAPRAKAMGTSRQHAPDLMQMREAAAQSPGVLGLHQLQRDAAAYSGAPIQRVVTKARLAPWAQKEQWQSSETGHVLYDSEDEAQAAEDRVIAEREARDRPLWNDAAQSAEWEIIGSARRHYNDGWGALYAIESDNDLINCIEQNENYPVSAGSHTIELGSHNHLGEYVRRPCTIVYNVRIEPLTVGSITEDVSVHEVFHCGPSDQ